MDRDIDMGIKIKIARIRKNMSTEELCEKADISRATLSALENGRGNPSRNLMIKISKILDTTARELFF